MNYLAHGYRFLQSPYFVAGTALPDWLNVVDRRCRVRSRHAIPFHQADDPDLAEFSRGVAQHHHDDGWFHETRAFVELNWQFAALFRAQLPGDDGMRPRFLGHILVELLLDDTLARQTPALLDAYYRTLQQVDAARIDDFVATLAGRPADGLSRFIGAFLEVRFLYDYRDDAKLCYRLNQVLRRVGLDALPSDCRDLLSRAREAVAARMPELLASAPTFPSVEEITR